jgi:hypothetical protein
MLTGFGPNYSRHQKELSKVALSQVGVSSYISRRPNKDRHPECLKREQGAEYRKSERMAKMNKQEIAQKMKHAFYSGSLISRRGHFSAALLMMFAFTMWR